LTWYGITDFRSSLDFERGGTGPILGALMSDEYSSVIILGCGLDERENDVAGVSKTQFDAEHAEVDKTNFKQMADFVQRYANTTLAHDHYVNWLKSSMEAVGCGAEVQFRPIKLKKLNDTEAIYEAANSAISFVSREHPAAMISLFLSPGTPVMAFVWALVALNFPRIKKRLISSSQPNKNPESISLPEEWMEWNGRQSREAEDLTEDFDVCFHLFGDQRLPSYWGIKQFNSQKHVFVTSKTYRPYELKPFLGDAAFASINVDPYDPEDVRTKILKWLETVPNNARVAFNLTGGTKMMYAGALSACRKINGFPFYFNIKSNSMINLLTFMAEPIKGIKSIEPFFALNGHNLKIANEGNWYDIPDINIPNRKELMLQLARHPGDLAKRYKELANASDVKLHNGKVTREGFVPFDINSNSFSASIDASGKAHLSISNRTYEFAHFPGFAKFITGGWFEEWVYYSLKPLADNGKIFDLRIGFEVSFEALVKAKHFYGENNTEDKSFQELDITFTDGSRLYIIECKAGKVTSEHVMKLENVIEKFGGVGGRGILAACFEPDDEVVKKRLRESRACKLVFGQNLAEQIEGIITADRKAYLQR
ncbi:MAG: DUF1887 family protein, partial [Kiritimatiellae bacterium]|nr:DUF1887 family protein [Kiritimatiellia bacterium]